MQSDKINICREKYFTQYRLLISGLMREHQHIRSFVFTALDFCKEKEYEKRFETLVQEAAFYSTLLELSHIPSQKQTEKLLSDWKLLKSKQNLNEECLKHILKKQFEILPLSLRQNLGFVNK